MGVSHHGQSHDAEDQHTGPEQGSLREVAAQPPNDQALDDLGESERAEVGMAGPGRLSGLRPARGLPLLPTTPGPQPPVPAARKHRAEGEPAVPTMNSRFWGDGACSLGDLTHVHTHAHTCSTSRNNCISAVSGVMKVTVLVAPSCLTLCRSMDCSPPGSSVHGILQARTLEWVAISFSRGSSGSRDHTWGSCIAGRFFPV